ncbi:MAG: hypothetical protein OEQ25_02280 [Gammaproteobacteria bacterium]|nr:hypothetical protein [Gammaproteobacteria bacterium]
MYAPATRSRSLRHLSLVVVTAQALLGCQSLPDRSAPSRLDPRTGVTVSTADDVLVFARTEGRYSRSARDYVYLGPVELNRQGLREYFLWVGVATTLDRGYLAPEIGVPTKLQLMLRGEPMEFSLRPWAEIAPGLNALSSYQTSVELQHELGARVTRDQLRLLETARAESLRVTTGNGGTKLYQAWQNEVHWSEVLALGY